MIKIITIIIRRNNIKKNCIVANINNDKNMTYVSVVS